MNLALELARTGEGAKAGPIGLAVILILCIVCYFLFKSMSKHMRRVRENFPEDAVTPETPPMQPTQPTPPGTTPPADHSPKH